ncbi:MAG: lipoxygenase family protein [Cyanobacteria bacterium J06634_5]
MTQEAFFQQLTARSRGIEPNFETSQFDDSELELARQKYQYNYIHLPPLALIDTLPPEEEFSSDWLRMLLFKGIHLLINTLAVNRGDRGREGLSDDIRRFLLEALVKQPFSIRRTVVTAIVGFVKELRQRSLGQSARDLDDVIIGVLKRVGKARAKEIVGAAAELLLQDTPKGRPPTVEGYLKLFQEMETPAIAAGFEDDDVFVYLRVAGPNPIMLEKIKVLETNFPVTEAQYQAVMGPQDTLQAAGEEGRLYLIDYAIFTNALSGSFPEEQKYMSAPIALFAVPAGTDSGRQLKVVAIQCDQTPGPDNPVMTPPGPEASEAQTFQWQFAKSMVQIADGNFHEAVSHLGRTHLLIEPFVMATHRQLPKAHPLSLLLRPHFQGTLAINNAAHRKLIAPGGGVDRLLGATIDNDRVLAALGLQSLGFNDAMLPNQLKARGVDDPACLPVYPYRDDALLLWSAIHDWASAYLGLYYSSDGEVQQDVALQNWASELTVSEGGRLQGFGEPGKTTGETTGAITGAITGEIKTLAYLIDVATMVIFTASVQHAAVNFPQYELMGYAPGFPLAGYLPPTKVTSIQNEQDFIKFLAPLDQAQKQLNLLYLLSSVNYTKLGYYPEKHFTDDKVIAPLQQFQARLEKIEDTIEASNFKRPPYEYLLPSRIPQSINI